MPDQVGKRHVNASDSMSLCGSYLEEYAQSLGCAAAEAADAEHAEAALCEIAKQLAQCTTSGAPLNLDPLYQSDLTPSQTGRLVRVLEVQCIELLRRKCPADEFAENVLTLRRIIQLTLPPNDECRKGVAVYRQLIHGDSEINTAEARRFQSLLAGMMKTTPNLVYLHDLNGNLFYLNDFGLEMVGYSREDVSSGLSVHDFVVPDYVDLVESRMVSSRKKVAPFSIEIYAKNGERIPVEIITRIVRDDTLMQDLVLGIARDLRLERRLQNDIARAHTILDAVMNYAPIGIVVADESFAIVEANAAAADLAGAPSVHALVGVHMADLLDQPHEETVKWLQCVADGGGEYRETFSLRSRFGHPFACTCMAAPLKHVDGARSGLVLMLSTAAPESTGERIQDAEINLNSLGNVVGRIAHELNNPLTGIIGYSEVLRQLSDDPKFRTRLDHILEESHRCRRIIESLQAFVDRGERKHVVLDLNSLLDDSLSLIQYQLSVNRIALELNKASDLPTIAGPRLEMQRAVLNVLVNAQQSLRKVSDRQRILRIETRKKDDEFVELVIEDNGAGISPNFIERVFEPFFTTRDIGEGMGLGLSISYAVLRDCGGTIRCERAEPQGARFILSFMCAKD
ncbi:MAG: hypothetical protein AMXMBFR84_42270 [Candidatus Hydrogenedentota bacterium]